MIKYFYVTDPRFFFFLLRPSHVYIIYNGANIREHTRHPHLKRDRPRAAKRANNAIFQPDQLNRSRGRSTGQTFHPVGVIPNALRAFYFQLECSYKNSGDQSKFSIITVSSLMAYDWSI